MIYVQMQSETFRRVLGVDRHGSDDRKTVLFMCGGIVEVWAIDKWIKMIQSVTFQDIERATEELGKRANV